MENLSMSCKVRLSCSQDATCWRLRHCRYQDDLIGRKEQGEKWREEEGEKERGRDGERAGEGEEIGGGRREGRRKEGKNFCY